MVFILHQIQFFSRTIYIKMYFYLLFLVVFGFIYLNYRFPYLSEMINNNKNVRDKSKSPKTSYVQTEIRRRNIQKNTR